MVWLPQDAAERDPGALFDAMERRACGPPRGPEHKTSNRLILPRFRAMGFAPEPRRFEASLAGGQEFLADSC